MDNVTDLRLEPRELASRGFRFVKLRANLILNRSGITADIHPGDLPDLLARFGIDLIAEKIESEGSVVDLLDYDVKFGQGFLFSPPRPVRAEALQGIAERNDVVARESAASDQGQAPGRQGRWRREQQGPAIGRPRPPGSPRLTPQGDSPRGGRFDPPGGFAHSSSRRRCGAAIPAPDFSAQVLAVGFDVDLLASVHPALLDAGGRL